MGNPAEDAIALISLILSALILVVIYITIEGGDPGWVISIAADFLPGFIIGIVLVVLFVTVLQQF